MLGAFLIGAIVGAGPIDTDRELERLPAEPTLAFARAAEGLGERVIELAEAEIDGATLRRLASPPAGEPLLRHVRETLGRPVDLSDLVLFLDDVLAAGTASTARISVPASRARAYGILLHPQDVFRNEPRRYGTFGELPVDDPPSQLDLEPARDGEVAGPRWTARYQQPMTDLGKIEELERENPRFGRAVRTLFLQLEKQGAFTWIEAGVRPRERGFLLYASWYVSRAPNPRELEARIARVNGYERAWGLDVPITWRHPDGFRASVEAARAMADTYGVDYATPRGAKSSSHYGGGAVDLVAVDLPRTLELTAPDGASRVFDLSDPDSPRDLSLLPEVIDWVEQHFGMQKLRRDYPHWSSR